MANMLNYKTRSDALCTEYADFIRHTQIMLSNDNIEDALIVKVNVSAETAAESLNEKISKAGVYKVLSKVGKIEASSLKKEYYPVLASHFDVTSVTYEYDYWYNGNLIDISPKTRGCNVPKNTYLMHAADYSKESYDGEWTNDWDMDNVYTTDLVENVEEGFAIHKLSHKDWVRDQKYGVGEVNKELKKVLGDVIQNQELGVSRRLESIVINDKEYTYNDSVMLVPYYVYTVDLGKKIITVLINAHTGRVSVPLTNNPLGTVDYHMTGKAPKFNLIVFIIACCTIIGIPVYIFDYFKSKSKFKKANADAEQLSLEELKKLI